MLSSPRKGTLFINDIPAFYRLLSEMQDLPEEQGMFSAPSFLSEAAKEALGINNPASHLSGAFHVSVSLRAIYES